MEQTEPWVVDRPAEVSQIVGMLRRRGGTAGITTAVHGAGGFGKTTVAKMVRGDRRVLRRFRGRVYWVTVGRDAGEQTLVRLVNDLIARVEPGRTVTFTTAEQAADHLAAVLAEGPRRLLILDDVWTEEQLAAFRVPKRCARLVTTRIHSLAADAKVAVRIDQMSEKQARRLLLVRLPPLAPVITQALVEETGRWPLLLRLVNKIIADQAKLQPDVTAAAEDLLSRLRRGGALQVDQLTGATARQLDINNPAQRKDAIRATIQASTSLLTSGDYERFIDLSVFAADETIPITLITALWQATGNLEQMAAGTLCARLADLALVTLTSTSDGGAIEVHDVIREYLRDELGDTRLRQLHQILLGTVAESLPNAGASIEGAGAVTAWWKLSVTTGYLWDHLIEHLIAAGRAQQAGEVAADLRWVGARLQAAGPAGPYADLALVGAPRTERLRRVLGQAAHLLAPTDPPHSLTDILYSRVGRDPDWGPQAEALTASRTLPALITKWPLPDLPHPALLRTLTGHTGQVLAVAIAPDGTWLATASRDSSVRIWDLATGQQRTVLTDHASPVTSVAIAPDGTWLASVSSDGTVRIWDTNTGQLDRTRTGAIHRMSAFTLSPDGRLLVSGTESGTVRIWHAANGGLRAEFSGHTSAVTSVAIAPDGTWLTTASKDRTVRIWDLATGQQRTELTGHTGATSVAIAPDGTWLTTVGYDGTVRIWDLATGQQRTELTGHTGATSVAIAPDGTWLTTASKDCTVRIWDTSASLSDTISTGRAGHISPVASAPDARVLASGSDDGSVLIWDTNTGQQRAGLTGHTGQVLAVAIAPDGTWLATASSDGTVPIWDLATGQQRTALTGHTSAVTSVAIAPDGTWLATASFDGTVRIWDTNTGQQRTAVTGHTMNVISVAIAPDGTWLATASRDRSARIWDLATGQQRTALTGHTSPVTSVAIAPDGTWLATASSDETIRIWDTNTGQQRTALTGITSPVMSVAIARDATWLAAVSTDETIRIWDPDSGRISAVMRVDSQLRDCTWNPSDHSLAAAGDAGLYLFNFNS